MKIHGTDTMIRFGVVGYGHIGKRHVQLIQQLPQAKLMAVCDTQFNEDECGLPFFQNLDRMLEEVDMDIVVIATPHYLHFEQTMQILSKGCHVLVEKPMALNTTDARKMVEYAEEKQLKLWVVKQNRYNTPVFALEHLIKTGKMGAIHLVECQVLWNRVPAYYSKSNWRGSLSKEGGALFTHASHFIDLMVDWCGPIVDASGYCIKRQQNIETEDVGCANIQFQSGTLGSIQWTTLAHEKNFEGSIAVVGEKGTVKIGGPYLNQFDYWKVEGYPLPGINWGEDVEDEQGLYQSFGNNHGVVYQAIMAELRTDKKMAIDGRDGVKSIEAIEMIYQRIQRLSC